MLISITGYILLGKASVKKKLFFRTCPESPNPQVIIFFFFFWGGDSYLSSESVDQAGAEEDEPGGGEEEAEVERSVNEGHITGVRWRKYTGYGIKKESLLFLIYLMSWCHSYMDIMHNATKNNTLRAINRLYL